MPLTSTPPSLIPQMLEAEYGREVTDKLNELKETIQGVIDKMRAQSELVLKKAINCQDKVDRSLAAL